MCGKLSNYKGWSYKAMWPETPEAMSEKGRRSPGIPYSLLGVRCRTEHGNTVLGCSQTASKEHRNVGWKSGLCARRLEGPGPSQF